MFAVNQEETPLAQDLEELNEAIRRYRLPFGIAGKHNAYKKAQAFPKKARNVVLQDFRVLTPAEYIFGLHAGDCVSLTVDILKFRPEYTSQIEFLTHTFEPTFVIIAAARDKNFTPKALREFATSVSSQVGAVKKRVKENFCEVRSCIVDERSRDVIFI